MNARGGRASALRRLVITVCPREAGTVALSLTAGAKAARLDAKAIGALLEALVTERRLGHLVSVREACAGGCAGPGPNVSVTIYPAPRPEAAASQVAIGWRTYVYSLASLPCLAHIIDDNLLPPPTSQRRGVAGWCGWLAGDHTTANNTRRRALDGPVRGRALPAPR